MQRRLLMLTGATVPVLQAPMAGSSGGRLARAVASAGGVGFLGAAFQSVAWLEREWAVATDGLTGTSSSSTSTTSTSAPSSTASPSASPSSSSSPSASSSSEQLRARIGIGLAIFDLVHRPELLDATVACAPSLVWLGFGDPTPYVTRLRAAGCRTLMQVNSVAEAERAVRAGVDIIVAQGADAGGHGRSLAGTLALVPTVVDALAHTQVPVVAAGGIADGRGLAAVLALGASGAALGTRFYASTECAGPGTYKDLIVAARDGGATVRTPVFDVLGGSYWPSEFDGRALRNTVYERHRAGAVDKAALERYKQATKDRDPAEAAVWAGEGVGLIRSVASAGDILRSLVADARRVAAELPSKL